MILTNLFQNLDEIDKLHCKEILFDLQKFLNRGIDHDISYSYDNFSYELESYKRTWSKINGVDNITTNYLTPKLEFYKDREAMLEFLDKHDVIKFSPQPYNSAVININTINFESTKEVLNEALYTSSSSKTKAKKKPLIIDLIKNVIKADNVEIQKIYRGAPLQKHIWDTVSKYGYLKEYEFQPEESSETERKKSIKNYWRTIHNLNEICNQITGFKLFIINKKEISLISENCEIVKNA